MGSAVPLRVDFDTVTLRRLARRCGNARQAGRLLALAAVYDGMSRTDATRIGDMDRQTLCDWVHRFNDEGPDGLLHRKGAGRSSFLTQAQKAELSTIVETGPDPAVDGVVRWRRIDLQRVIQERFGVTYQERSISDLLKELGFSRLSGRPQHPRQDEQVMVAFKKTFPERSRPTEAICPPTRLSRCGSRMRRGSDKRTVRPASGRAREHGRACPPTSLTSQPTCSALSAPSAAPAQP